MWSTGVRKFRQALPTKLWNRRIDNLYGKATNLLLHQTLDFFSVVEIETSTACNRRCTYCPNFVFERGLLKNTQALADELFYRIVDQLAELRFVGRMSPHFYGEPLLDERLPKFIRYFRSKLPLAKFVIFTNGDYLTLELYETLVEAGVDGLLITEHGSKMPPGVNEVLAHRKRHGTDGVIVDYRKFTSETELSNRGGVVEHENLETKEDCDLPAENITIDHRGNVVLCCNDYHSSVTFGNIAEERLLDIWRKPNFVKLRRELRQGTFELEICKKCAAGKIAEVAPTPLSVLKPAAE